MRAIVRGNSKVRRRSVHPIAVLRRAGFTMVEIIVVIVIIVALAGVILPRMIGGADRALRIEAENVRQLLSTLGQRGVLGSQSAALQYDPKSQELSLWTKPHELTGGMDPSESGSSGAGATTTKSTDDSIGTQWKLMPLVRPVRLSSAEVGAIIIDGRPLTLPTPGAGGGGEPIRLELPQGQTRPSICVVLRRAGGALSAARAEIVPGVQIDLTSEATAARSTPLSDARQVRPMAARGEDLDVSGRRETAW